MDLLIKNARFLDPHSGEESELAVGIEKGKICRLWKGTGNRLVESCESRLRESSESRLLESSESCPREHPGAADGGQRQEEAGKRAPQEKKTVRRREYARPKAVVDARGAYLLPGMIDFHTHLFTGGSAFGINGDLLLSSGVAMAIDMGTAGSVGYEAFHCLDVCPRTIKIKSFLNLSPLGQPGGGIHEPLLRERIKEEKIEELAARYSGEILGIKVRISRSIVEKEGISPLDHALELGERLGLPVCVHTTDPPVPAAEIVKRLRAGDIYSHMYHNKGMTILDGNGRVFLEFHRARERGVFMEVGNGRMNFSFRVAEQAMDDGIFPDIISSDATAGTLEADTSMKDLSFVMSKFWNLGMPLYRVFAAVTAAPGRCLGLPGRETGRLREGMEADLTLLRAEKRQVEFADSEGEKRQGNWILRPEMTVIDGKIVYLQGEAGFAEMN